MIDCAGNVGTFQYAIMLATSDPMVMPGHADRPSKMINAKPIPEGGQAGRAVVFSNSKK